MTVPVIHNMKGILIFILGIGAVDGETTAQAVAPVPLNAYGLSYVTSINQFSVRIYYSYNATHI